MSQQALTPNLERFFATPAIYFPDMNDPEWQFELDRMMVRSFATRDFVNGILAPDDFLDLLDETGVDPIGAASAWEQGISYL